MPKINMSGHSQIQDKKPAGVNRRATVTRWLDKGDDPKATPVL
jgi:hypothetical protein